MLGRLACDNPYLIAEIYHELYPDSIKLKRSQIFIKYLEYLLDEHSKGVPLSLLIKPRSGETRAKRRGFPTLRPIDYVLPSMVSVDCRSLSS
jgi:hypothetical protein